MSRYRTSSSKAHITDTEAVKEVVQDYIIDVNVFIKGGKIGATGDGQFKVYDEPPTVPGQGEDVKAKLLNELRPYIEDGEQLQISIVDKNETETIRYIVEPDQVIRWNPDGSRKDLTQDLAEA